GPGIVCPRVTCLGVTSTREARYEGAEGSSIHPFAPASPTTSGASGASAVSGRPGDGNDVAPPAPVERAHESTRGQGRRVDKGRSVDADRAIRWPSGTGPRVEGRPPRGRSRYTDSPARGSRTP